MNIDEITSIHFIGIGGIGISALAKMMLKNGKIVSGINDSESKDTLEELRSKGVNIIIGTDEDICIDADVYVYSVAWEAKAPKLLEKVRATKKPTMSYFAFLGEVAKEYTTIAISGTHGKTTTTAMVAQSLIATGFDPTVIVGSLVDWSHDANEKRSNFRAGSSKYLIVEACEYKRHFLHFYPYIFAITNLEFDHPDYYKGLTDVKDAFAQAVLQAQIVLDDKNIEVFLPQVPKLKVLGEYNRRNAALALAVADTLGADMNIVKKALSEFRGSWRRLEYKGKTKIGAFLYDDYAHHPTAIKVTLKAVRDEYPEKKILVVFEPHMFSRTKEFFTEFGLAFRLADKVIVAPIFAAREDPIEGVNAVTLAQEIVKNNKDARSAGSLAEVVTLIKESVTKDYVVILMGAGNLYTITQELQKD